MSSERLHQRLADMLRDIARIRRYVAGLSPGQFAADEKTRDAVERCLERIAEAARKIGDRLDEKYPDVEFAKLRQFGSVLRHDYDQIEPGLVWLALVGRLVPLEAACRRELGEGGGTRKPLTRP
ncbi:MAG: DUF86 domain-containing protein [Alphaproteobacteria bacterium]